MQPFRSELLARLDEHGVRPSASTDPALVRDFLNRLYVLQITSLRLKRKELEQFFGQQPLDGYKAEVEELSRRYEVLALPLDQWRQS